MSNPRFWKRDTKYKEIINIIKQQEAIGKENRIPAKNLIEQTGMKKTEFYGGIVGAKRYFRLIDGLFLRNGGRPRGYYLVNNRNDAIEPLTGDMSKIRKITFNFIDLWKAATTEFEGTMEEKKELELMKRKLVEAVMGW